jgi:hypothetical protein
VEDYQVVLDRVKKKCQQVRDGTEKEEDKKGAETRPKT